MKSAAAVFLFLKAEELPHWKDNCSLFRLLMAFPARSLSSAVFLSQYGTDWLKTRII